MLLYWQSYSLLYSILFHKRTTKVQSFRRDFHKILEPGCCSPSATILSLLIYRLWVDVPIHPGGVWRVQGSMEGHFLLAKLGRSNFKQQERAFLRTVGIEVECVSGVCQNDWVLRGVRDTRTEKMTFILPKPRLAKSCYPSVNEKKKNHLNRLKKTRALTFCFMISH